MEQLRLCQRYGDTQLGDDSVCMEDVRLGRKTATTQGTYPATTTTQLVIQEDAKRVLLIILPPASGELTVGILASTDTGTGYRLPSTGSPLKLDIKKEGTLCCHAWYIRHDAGGVNVNWFEGRLEQE